MLSFAFRIAGKDLRSLIGDGGLSQAVLLGLLVIFVFSLSNKTGTAVTREEAAAIFWLGSVFCQTLIFNQLYGGEEKNGVKKGLLLAPAPPQGVWLGKAFASAPLLLFCQILLAVATAVFLNRELNLLSLAGVAALLLTDAGLCAAGSLLGAASRGSSRGDSLTAVLLFPLLAPALLAGVSVTASDAVASSWLVLLAAFDAMFAGAGLILFPFIYGED